MSHLKNLAVVKRETMYLYNMKARYYIHILGYDNQTKPNSELSDENLLEMKKLNTVLVPVS